MIVDLDDAPEVVATIVTLGPSERLTACLRSLESAAAGTRMALLCIVNSADLVAPEQRRPAAHYRSAGLNLGWAGGLAFSRTLHDAPFMWLIQDDMLVSQDCLAELRADLSEGYVATSPTGLLDGGLVDPSGFGHHVSHVLPTPWFPPAEPFPLGDLDVPDTMPYLPSRGMLVETRAWDLVGGYDPRFYPVVWADVDFCMALRASGLAFRHSRRGTVRHLGQGSTPTAMGKFLSRRNSDLFRAKWLGWLGDGQDSSTVPTSREMLGRMTEPVQSMALGADLPEWLTTSTAVSASDAFLQLARTYSREASEWDLRLAQQSRSLAESEARVEALVGDETQNRRAVEEAWSEAERLRGELRSCADRAEAAETTLNQVLNSRSWRLSGSARSLMKSLRGLRK